MIKVNIKGQREIRAKLIAINKFVLGDMGEALRVEAEIEATEAKLRTPVDTGDLRNSIHVEGPEHKGHRVSCEIIAGGIAAEYALIVHEDLEAFHKVGQAKYIESVINESAPYFADRVAARMRRSLE